MDNIHDLNDSDRKLLEDVLMKDIHELTDYDIQVINARRSYLNYSQRQVYKSILIDDGNMPGDEEQQLGKPHEQTEWNDPKKQATQAQQAKQPATPMDNTANQEAPAQPDQKANPYDVNPETLA